MDKVVAFDQSASLGGFPMNEAGTDAPNKAVTLRSNFGKKTL